MDRTSAREQNAAMVDRISAAPAEPIPDGGYALRVVRTRGRRSGEMRSTPLGVLGRGGALYLVSPQAGRDWVRNLLADPECEVVAGGTSTSFSAVTPPSADAAGAVAGYLAAVQVPWALRAFPVAADAGQDEISAHLDEMAVLRLDPR